MLTASATLHTIPSDLSLFPELNKPLPFGNMRVARQPEGERPLSRSEGSAVAAPQVPALMLS